MAKQDRKVTFIRKNGKVIPIRGGKSKDTAAERSRGSQRRRPAKKKKEEKSIFRKVAETSGFKVFTAGTFISGFGQLGGGGGEILRDKTLNKAVKAIDRGRTPVGTRLINNALKIQKFAKVSRKVEALGFAVQVVGGAASALELLRGR